MLYNYIALAIFAALAFLVPLSLIISAKLLGRRSQGNPIKNAPYESAEESVGKSRDIKNEYLPFFSLFLAFEVIVGILLVWSAVAYSAGYTTGIGIIVLALASCCAAGFGYKVAVG